MLMGEQRSVRLLGGHNNRVTSVRLEIPFWNALEQIADDAGCSLPQLISTINTHYVKKSKGITLASCLRVACLKLSARSAENAKLKRLLAEQVLDNSTLKEMLGKNF